MFSPNTGDSVLRDGIHEITVSYAENNITMQGNFIREAVGNNDFIRLCNFSPLGLENTPLVGGNQKVILDERSSDIIIYSTYLSNGYVHDVKLNDYIGFQFNNWYFNNCNVLFPSENYSWNYNAQNIYTVRFSGSSFFNGHVQLPNGVTSCCSTFLNCEDFNQPVVIPASVSNCESMFSNCSNFNQPVEFLGNNVTDCKNIFRYYHRFNQP